MARVAAHLNAEMIVVVLVLFFLSADVRVTYQGQTVGGDSVTNVRYTPPPSPGISVPVLYYYCESGTGR